MTASDGSTYIDVDHLDGMYSFCRTEKGAIVHLAASADLVPTAEGYVLSLPTKTPYGWPILSMPARNAQMKAESYGRLTSNLSSAG